MLFLCCYFFINNTLLATSVIMEAKRKNAELPFEIWEPFSWEYASAISMVILIPLIYIFTRKFTFDWQAITKTVFTYFLASIVFSLLHVGIMVGIKEVVYWLMAREYQFGQLWFELIYEYRKDLWSFCFIVAVIYAYDFILSRLQGEANIVVNNEDEDIPQNFDRLLVKKLGKEFIIKVGDIEWLEASGNYVNLHMHGRIYPMRSTLSGLIEQIHAKGFCRIHRSFAINLNEIESITPLSSGDSEIKLSNGKILTLSRRYKEEFKRIFQPV